MIYNGTKIGLKANFSIVTKREARRQWNIIFKGLRENTKIYIVKLSLK